MPSMASWMRRRWSFVRRTSVRRSSQRLQRVIGRIGRIGSDAYLYESSGVFQVRSQLRGPFRSIVGDSRVPGKFGPVPSGEWGSVMIRGTEVQYHGYSTVRRASATWPKSNFSDTAGRYSTTRLRAAPFGVGAGRIYPISSCAGALEGNTEGNTDSFCSTGLRRSVAYRF